MTSFLSWPSMYISFLTLWYLQLSFFNQWSAVLVKIDGLQISFSVKVLCISGLATRLTTSSAFKEPFLDFSTR